MSKTAKYQAIELNLMFYLLKWLLCVTTGKYNSKFFTTRNLHRLAVAQFYASKPKQCKNKPITVPDMAEVGKQATDSSDKEQHFILDVNVPLNQC